MKQKSTRRPTVAAAYTPGSANQRQRSQMAAGVKQQIDDIYLQFDAQLTRMAQIQLRFDEVRSKIRRM